VSVGDPPRERVRLADLVDDDERDALQVPRGMVERFGGAFHRVDAADERAVAACFTRAYTRSPVYAGSYLVRGGGVRFFSPEEIARLHGHPPGFSFGVPEREGWKLVGNGLSVPVVRWVVSWLP
jgi:site-specific DNA-cytosine methylase